MLGTDAELNGVICNDRQEVRSIETREPEELQHGLPLREWQLALYEKKRDAVDDQEHHRAQHGRGDDPATPCFEPREMGDRRVCDTRPLDARIGNVVTSTLTGARDLANRIPRARRDVFAKSLLDQRHEDRPTRARDVGCVHFAAVHANDTRTVDFRG